MSLTFAVALGLLAVSPTFSARVEKREGKNIENSEESTQVLPYEEAVAKCKAICGDPILAAGHAGKIMGKIVDYPSQEAPIYIYTFGGTATGKTSLQKHIQNGVRAEPHFIDTSKDALMWQWDQEWLDLMGQKGLTRDQRFGIRDVTRGCRMGADAVAEPLVNLAIRTKKDIYQECTRPDAAKSPPPLNEIFQADAGLLEESRKKWAEYAIIYAFNVAFDIESRITAEAERAETNGFIVDPKTLRDQDPFVFQWTYVKHAIALIKAGLGRSRQFFVQRKCVVKESPYVTEITAAMEQLASETTEFNPNDNGWMMTPSEVNEWMNKLAPVRTDCPAAVSPASSM